MSANLPHLTTPRLDLRPPVASDLQGLAAVMADDDVRRFLGNRPVTLADEFARVVRNAGSWALYGYGTFMIRHAGSTAIIGVCGVFHSWRGFGRGLDDTPEAGWILARAEWGKGLASEAVGAALAWFDGAHGPRRIACMIDPGNAASLALAARHNFVRYGEHDLDDGPVVLLERGAAEAPGSAG